MSYAHLDTITSALWISKVINDIARDTTMLDLLSIDAIGFQHHAVIQCTQWKSEIAFLMHDNTSECIR